jgi:hypothetical protein
VAVMSVAGAAGGVGGAALAGRAGMTGLRATVAIGATSGGASGGLGNAYTYMSSRGPHNVSGLLASTAEGTAFGAVTGGGAGAAGHGLAGVTGKLLGKSFLVDGTALSGHGGIRTGDPATFTVPKGVKINLYGPHGETIYDDLGNRIERQLRWPFGARPVEVARPGDVIPDYELHPPNGLSIMGDPVTVSTPTRISQLVEERGGTYKWAACREEY